MSEGGQQPSISYQHPAVRCLQVENSHQSAISSQVSAGGKQPSISYQQSGVFGWKTAINQLSAHSSSDVSRRRTSDIDRLKSQNDRLTTPPVGQFVPLNFNISGQCPISFQWNRTAPTRSVETKGRRRRLTVKPFEPEFLTGTSACSLWHINNNHL